MLAPKAKRSQHYVDNQPFEVIRCTSWRAPEGYYRFGRPFQDCKFNKRIKEEKFDILHTHSPFSMGKYAVKKGKKYGIPVVATLHTKYYDDFLRTLHGNKFLSNFMLGRIMKIYKNADSVWTVNNASCRVLREYGYKGDIVVVRNGTDLKYPENDVELIDKVNKAHNLDGQKNVFIFVGRIAMYKNLELMAKSLKILKVSGADFKTIIVGSGFDEGKFKKIIDNLGLTENFIFTGPISDRTLLQGYYLRSDLFLFPSTFDTSSLVPIEAAAHKLPVILIKGSDTAECITDNFNGYLAEETPEAFAARIQEIIADPVKMKEIGEEASRSVYRSWEMVADEVLEKYKQVIADYKAKNNK